MGNSYIKWRLGLLLSVNCYSNNYCLDLFVLFCWYVNAIMFASALSPPRLRSFAILEADVVLPARKQCDELCDLFPLRVRIVPLKYVIRVFVHKLFSERNASYHYSVSDSIPVL